MSFGFDGRHLILECSVLCNVSKCSSDAPRVENAYDLLSPECSIK